MDFYRPSHGGHTPTWGSPTSTLNFCEEDYQFTPHIAELFNTLTNLTYIALGLHGLSNNRRRNAKRHSENLPYIALIVLGIGSSLFHGSLKYATQMVDEFSMLFGTFIVFYRLLCLSPSTYLTPRNILLGLCTQMLIVIFFQIKTGESTVQQITFTCMIWYLWYQTFALIASTVKDEEMKRKMRIMAVSGIALFCTGHVCWITDFYACDRLRLMRERIGIPWAGVLELHGWWHILTGVGVYLFIVLVEGLQYASRPDLLGTSLYWPLLVHIKRDPLLTASSTEDKKEKKML